VIGSSLLSQRSQLKSARRKGLWERISQNEGARNIIFQKTRDFSGMTSVFTDNKEEKFHKILQLAFQLAQFALFTSFSSEILQLSAIVDIVSRR
jgi:hypothetical protein